ncbi:hypothetical protein GCM10009744_25260 [Kribbella alba]|uniref:Alcohol dehydrogenase-like C-terminal domain-containing protein n=1 Tax=Kribbella alba TaxID=190197 RepID=A0ABP4R5U4_9ACTN
MRAVRYHLARTLGAKTVIGTASSTAKLDFIRSCGADAAVDISDASWPDRLWETAPGGVEMVLDAVGGKVFDQRMELLAPLGRMVTYGAISGELPSIGGNGVFSLRYITGVGLYNWRQVRPKEARQDVAEVSRLWQSGDLRTAIHGTYALTDTVAVHRVLDDRANLGRLIAIP